MPGPGTGPRTGGSETPLSTASTAWLYNRDGMCLLSHMNWTFKCNSGWR